MAIIALYIMPRAVNGADVCVQGTIKSDLVLVLGMKLRLYRAGKTYIFYVAVSDVPLLSAR